MMNEIEPIQHKFSKHIEDLSKITVDWLHDDYNQCANELKIFQKQCKIISVYYNLLFKSSNVMGNYIKNYFEEVKNSEKSHLYDIPRERRLKEIGLEFKKVLSDMSYSAYQFLQNKKYINEKNEYSDKHDEFKGYGIKDHKLKGIYETKSDHILISSIEMASKQIGKLLANSNIYATNHLDTKGRGEGISEDLMYYEGRTNAQLESIEKFNKDEKAFNEFLRQTFGIERHFNK